MKPNSTTRMLASTMSSSVTTSRFHTAGTPATRAPTTLPRAATTNAPSMETTATETATTALASTTRPRWGTSVNVVRPVRWLHSPVTDRIAIIGRMIAIGKPIEAAYDP